MLRRLAAVLAGIAVGLLALLAIWGLNLLPPPEALSRRLAAINAVYPGPVGEAVVERIPCAPLRDLRLYAVCTRDCEEVWRIVGVRGLSAVNVSNLNRLPAEPPGEARRRLNRLVAREGLRFDAAGAAAMVGCYLRLEGFDPGLVLDDALRVRVEEVAGDEEAMRRLADGLDEAEGEGRIPVEPRDGGFRSRLLYWDTSREGWPILEIEYGLGADGQLESVRGLILPPAPDGTVSGSTPDTPPT